MRVLLLAAVLFVVGSCKKDVDPPAAPEAIGPKINLTSPVANQAYTNASVVVNGVVSSNTKLVQVIIEITNATTGSFFTHEHFAPTEASFTLNRSFALPAGYTYNIHIEALDVADKGAEKNIKVTVN